MKKVIIRTLDCQEKPYDCPNYLTMINRPTSSLQSFYLETLTRSLKKEEVDPKAKNDHDSILS